ncbi:hypothetical protein RIF23_03205 [Lipingzhangella sp. LS1_29]|uniref:Uncharacterized protein n=1 Tax=Lipingzhangella rawalii TaxID=2055835 RepID=A0ABU2H1X9_9ACTN|nr:hypothetical protein [Lipingzhangella rawalii]MDS1269301.1 hypothetical protein [Lipingzhangella rawalii]
MTSTTIDRSTLRAARRVVLDYILGALFFTAGGLALALALAVGVHLFVGPLSESGWSSLIQIVLWFLLGLGVYCTTVTMPQLLSHGRTRREFTILYTLALLSVGPATGVLIVGGYWLEGVLYGALEAPHTPAATGFYTAPDQFWAIFVGYTLTVPVWIAVGGLVGAGFYRSHRCALGVLPVAAALLWTVHIHVLGSEPVSLPQAVPAAVAAVVGCVAVTWLVVRTIPLRPWSR